MLKTAGLNEDFLHGSARELRMLVSYGHNGLIIGADALRQLLRHFVVVCRGQGERVAACMVVSLDSCEA
jgi:hypothetical protein